MAQASSQWRNLVRFLEAVPPAELGNRVPRRSQRSRSWLRWSAPGGWLLLSSGSIGLLFWNGRLVIATSIGVAIMMLVYLLQDSKWKPWKGLQPFLKGWNQPFTIAAASGGAAMFGTYLASSVWLEAENHWIATGMIFQGTATMGMLGLLVWQMMGRKSDRKAISLSQILTDLTHTDALKRLIAVRQLATLIEQQHDRLEQRQTADYLRVMLSREEDPIVRDAILDGLKVLDESHGLPSSPVQPLEMPRVNVRPKMRQVRSIDRSKE